MPSTDRRVSRTRLALQYAFTRLMFRDGFDALSVGQIADEANVGRSTFYKYFENKEAMLNGGMSRFFRVFAECTTSEGPPSELCEVLAHLWERRRLGEAIFAPTPRAMLTATLANMIEAEFKQAAADAQAPLRLGACYLAEAQIGLVATWLKGETPCAPDVMAHAFHASSRAAARAWLSAPLPQMPTMA